MKQLPVKFKKVVRYCIYLAVISLFLICACFLVTIYSSWGSRNLLNVAAYAAGGQLKADSISNGIAENLIITGLKYRDSQVQVEVNSLELRWDWVDIFYGGITIAKFHIDKTNIKLLNTSQDKPVKSNQPFNYKELMGIDLGLLIHLKLNDISISETSVLVDEQKFSIEAAQLSSSLDDEVFQINIVNTDADIDGQGIGVKTSLTIDTQGDLPVITGDYAWNTNIEKNQYSGSGRIDGDLSNLAIAHNLQEPWKIDTQINFGISAQMKPKFSMTTKWSDLDLSTVGSPAVLKNGDVNISGGSNGLSFVIATSAKPSDQNNTLVDFNTAGSFDWHKVKIDSMNIKSENIFNSSISGEVGLGTNIEWKMDSKTTIHNIDKYVPALEVSKITPEIRLSGKFILDEKNGASDVSIMVPNILGSNLISNIDLNFSQDQVKAITKVSSPFIVNSELNYGITDNSINLLVDWQNVFWPLVTGAVAQIGNDDFADEFAVHRDDLIISPTGKISILGSIENYKLDTKFSVKYDKWHPVIEAKGKGSLDSFQVETSKITTVAGNLVSDGEIIWGPQVSWQANIFGDSFDMNAFDLQKSNISFKLSNQGIFKDGAVKAQTDLVQLGGTISKDKLSGAGKFDISQTKSLPSESPLQQDQQLEAKELAAALTSDINLNLGVKVGETKAQVSLNALQNQWMRKIDGKYDINVESLSQFIPESKGKVSLLGKISGDNNSLKAKGDATVTDMRVDSFSLNGGKLDYIVTQHNESDLFAKFSGSLTDINAEQVDLKSIKIDGEGSLLSHKIKLSMDGNYTGGLVLSGIALEKVDTNNSKAPIWNGVVEDFNIVNEDIGKWTNKNITITYQGDDFSVANTCFIGSFIDSEANLTNTKPKVNSSITVKQNPNDEICISSEISAHRIDTKLAVNRLNLQRFASLVPSGIGIYGAVKGDTSIFIQEFDYLNAKLSSQFVSEEGALELTMLNNEKKTLPFNFHFLTKLDDHRGDLTFSAKVKDGLNSQGKISFALPNSADRLNEAEIDSAINIDMNNFEWVDEIWPEFESVTGKLTTNARVFGRLDDLQYSGSSNISDGNISIIPAGIVVSDAALSVDFDADKTVFSGKGRSGDGAISIAGDFDKKNLYPINIDILGDKFQVVDIYEAKVAISPLLKLKLLENKAIIDGSINIDNARIRIGDLPETAVTVSEDAVVIKNRGDSKQQVPYQTDADISLNLGDEFSFKGFGLTTKIAGGLNVKQANGLREGFGELELKEGKFKKLGIKLDIETGQLIFVGPIENPALNIKAARKLEQARRSNKVSVMITGTLKKPVLVFPEESTYGQTNAMSNLLTGKSVGDSGGGGGNEALYSVGLSAGGKFKDQVQDELGIDAMEITAAGWMLGKYLTPDLYLSYTTGWIENESALKLRYSLSEMLSVEVNSGQQQGVDLFYSIEKP